MADVKELAQSYVDTKAQLDPLKKSSEKINAELKTEMTKLKLDFVELDDVIVKKNIKVKEGFNNDKLIETLKSLGKTNCIKTKEYVDTDIMEDMIYSGEITEKDVLEIAKCQTKTETVELRISKIKREVSNE